MPTQGLPGAGAPPVDHDLLDRHIVEMYRDVAHEAVDDLHFITGRPVAEAVGYPSALLDRLPAGAVASFAGVGYHLDLAAPVAGDRVLDLGSGSGMDAFAAATLVGDRGAVDGVDITPEQLAKAERLRGEMPVRLHRARIEALPFPDGTFDVVISNGVLNLSPDKARAFAEAARVLRPGGRLALSDVVTDRPIAPLTASHADLWAACIAGAAPRTTYLEHLAAAGLALVAIRENPSYRFASKRAQHAGGRYGAHSASLLARKPTP
ncbi:tRNA methyltransferase [Baekduia alba]|uniref:methyltransferase domain-containing protein n=1 Tax=Baekduia alba TaxID=2997333 RepID=UPI0023415340|nr:methyltransferase domain-containing protein [Baekduia alba]WCB93807.1 tRNA methyltransferase [Baekduia alba]